MAEATDEDDDRRASPASISNPQLRFEAKRALVGVVVVGLAIFAV